MKNVGHNIDKAVNVGEIVGKFLRKMVSKPLLFIISVILTLIFGSIYLVYGLIMGVASKDNSNQMFV